MTLYKRIGGERIPMSEEEEAAIFEERNTPAVISTDDINTDIDRLLSGTDWTQVTDVDLTTAEKATWNGYRAALRAVDRTPRPRDLGFPVPPSDTKRNGR